MESTQFVDPEETAVVDDIGGDVEIGV